MDYKQIHSKVEVECGYLYDKDCIRIYVTSSEDKPVTAGVLDSFQAEVEKCGIKARIILTGSFGYYDLEPMVTIEKPDSPAILYHNITPETSSVLVNDYLMGDNPRPELALCSIGGDKIAGIPDIAELPLFNLQNRIALRNCGFIDPENINHYILRGKGFSGLSRALQLGQKNVIRELKESGLRGRGGAGYFTADKWQICYDTEGSDKYTICNAVDADPGARTAQLLIESDPYSVLEGLLINAYAVGACHGFICINSEYSTAIRRLGKAFEQMRSYGLLGDDILDSNFRFDIEIKGIESSLVAGEETALLSALEGKQMMPYLRTTYPAERGLHDEPTLVNNVETMSNVSAIFQNNPELVSDIGTEKSRGTKVITLRGEIAHKYAVEVPFGTTLHTLVEDIGGGVSGGKDIKAVQFGGPTGSYFAGDSLDTAISYETMEETDTIIGSGTIDVYNSDSCAVKMARDVMAYLQTQSCGKCVFCREGTYQMSDILKDIADNKGKDEDLDLLHELAEGMKIGSICGLGSTAATPVLSSIKLFPGDYDAHIKEKRCRVNNSP